MNVAANVTAISTKKRRVRPMLETDIPQVFKLFFEAFPCKNNISEGDFSTYFRELFFNNPFYDPDYGSMVHEDAEGTIDSALSVLPLRYSINDAPIMGRLLCAFMSMPGTGRRGAAELALSVRIKGSEFCFSDSASPVSARHWHAVGGQTLPVHGLGWNRVFEPMGYVIHHIQRRSGVMGPLINPALGKPMDYFLRKKTKPTPIELRDECDVVALDKHEIMDAVKELMLAYDAYPVWERENFQWLLELINQNTLSGPLISQAVYDKSGELIGSFSYFQRPGKLAEVLSFLSKKGSEKRVVVNMLHYFERNGYIAAEGRASPRILPLLSEQRAMFFRHRAHVCVLNKNPELENAIASNELYISGFAGEGWSRLMTDFG